VLRNYHCTLHNIPEQRRLHPLHDGSPKSRIIKYLFLFNIFILPSVVLGRTGRSHHFLPANYPPVHGGGYKNCSLLRHNAVQSGGNLLMLRLAGLVQETHSQVQVKLPFTGLLHGAEFLPAS